MENKRSPLLPILLSVVLLLGLIVGLVFWLMAPKVIYQSYYSAINEHRAPISDTEYVRDLYVDETGSGRLSTCALNGTSLDVIEFGSYTLQNGSICFRELQFYGQRDGRKVVLESDGSYSLTLSFSLKEGGFVMESCHYERMKNG